MAAFTDILSCNHKGAIVVVTHSGVIRSFISTVLNKPLYGLEKAVHILKVLLPWSGTTYMRAGLSRR